jgi:hypothetical protein
MYIHKKSDSHFGVVYATDAIRACKKDGSSSGKVEGSMDLLF